MNLRELPVLVNFKYINYSVLRKYYSRNTYNLKLYRTIFKQHPKLAPLALKQHENKQRQHEIAHLKCSSSVLLPLLSPLHRSWHRLRLKSSPAASAHQSCNLNPQQQQSIMMSSECMQKLSKMSPGSRCESRNISDGQSSIPTRFRTRSRAERTRCATFL